MGPLPHETRAASPHRRGSALNSCKASSLSSAAETTTRLTGRCQIPYRYSANAPGLFVFSSSRAVVKIGPGSAGRRRGGQRYQHALHWALTSGHGRHIWLYSFLSHPSRRLCLVFVCRAVIAEMKLAPGPGSKTKPVEIKNKCYCCRHCFKGRDDGRGYAVFRHVHEPGGRGGSWTYHTNLEPPSLTKQAQVQRRGACCH
jgi:hypothetical protein